MFLWQLPLLWVLKDTYMIRIFIQFFVFLFEYSFNFFSEASTHDVLYYESSQVTFWKSLSLRHKFHNIKKILLFKESSVKCYMDRSLTISVWFIHNNIDIFLSVSVATPKNLHLLCRQESNHFYKFISKIHIVAFTTTDQTFMQVPLKKIAFFTMWVGLQTMWNFYFENTSSIIFWTDIAFLNQNKADTSVAGLKKLRKIFWFHNYCLSFSLPFIKQA